jgi:Sulfotransferase family
MDSDSHWTAQEPVLDPVFVMCNGRSGSTLLRFLLDAHPELACPPETNIPALCAQLATVWSLIEGAPLSADRGDEPPEIPDAAVTGIRHVMDLMTGSYLTRKGKQRYCDKSLGTARYAELLTRVYPQARFICLYRHPMDVIASGIEACPWGLNGYGFDPYIAATPGNVVLALARFWADNVATILAVEERFPGRCHRVRYEDLVDDPEQTAAQIFSFLGASPVPGISEACFSSERERFGPADHKIWRTSQIIGDSVGRGWSVPSAIIEPTLLVTVNEIASKLGYIPIDGAWGTTAPPDDLRVASTDAKTSRLPRTPNRADDDPPRPTAERCPGLLGEQLIAGLASAKADQAARWGPHATESFVAMATPGRAATDIEYWLVDLEAGTVTPAGREAQEKSDWDIVGSSDAWERIISNNLNLNVALRSCQLRYCDDAEAGPVAADTRLSILASLLGVANW